MQNGEITEVGTYEELVSAGKLIVLSLFIYVLLGLRFAELVTKLTHKDEGSSSKSKLENPNTTNSTWFRFCLNNL